MGTVHMHRTCPIRRDVFFTGDAGRAFPGAPARHTPPHPRGSQTAPNRPNAHERDTRAERQALTSPGGAGDAHARRRSFSPRAPSLPIARADRWLRRSSKSLLRATPLEGFLILLRSAGSERAAELGREQIDAHYQKTLSNALRGEDAALRAGVILSLVAGLQMMRQALGLPALVKARPAALERVIERVLRALIEPRTAKTRTAGWAPDRHAVRSPVAEQWLTRADRGRGADPLHFECGPGSPATPHARAR
jgi:hypothetical protein